MNTISAQHAGAWLRALPNLNLGLVMPIREFIIALQVWLGVGIFLSLPNSDLCFCGSLLDEFGDHLLGAIRRTTWLSNDTTPFVTHYFTLFLLMTLDVNGSSVVTLHLTVDLVAFFTRISSVACQLRLMFQ